MRALVFMDVLRRYNMTPRRYTIKGSSDHKEKAQAKPDAHPEGGQVHMSRNWITSSRHWVAFLWTGTQNSWYISYAATYMCAKLIANTYSEGNMKRTLKRRLKVFEIAGNEADETSVPWQDCLCASLWQCPELFCYYTVHLCVVCCLARHLVLCMSNLWKAWFFVLCKGMLANGLNHSAIIYCSRICPPQMSLCLVVGVCQLIAMTRLCRSSRGNHS